MPRALLAAALAAAVVAIGAAPAAAVPADELLERLERAVREARDGVRAPAPERMEEVRTAVGLPENVLLRGRTVRVPADPYLEGLEGERASDFQAAIRRLHRMSAELRAADDAPLADEATLRRELRRAYRGLDVEPGLWDRIGRLVRNFLGALARAVEGTVGQPVALVIVAVLIVAAAVAARRFGVRTVPEAAARDRGRGPSAADWRRRAEAARAAGDLREAVAAAYRSLVAELVERGLLEDRPSLTAGEVRRAVAPADGRPPPLGDATLRYERVRYGRVPPTDDDVAALLRAQREARAA